MIRLEKLHIHKLGNVAPNTQLTFSPRGALLLGKNGTGKTTLLNILVTALCCDWRLLSKHDDDGFDLEYTLRVAPPEGAPIRLQARLRGAPVRDPNAISRVFDQPFRTHHSLTISVGDGEGGAQLVEIVASQQGTKYIFPDHSIIHHPFSSHDLPSALSLRDPARGPAFSGAIELAQYLMRQLSLLHRYDEALHYFDNLTEEGDREPRVLASFFYQGEFASNADCRSVVFSESTCQALRAVAMATTEAPEHVRLEVSGQNPASDALPWLQDFGVLCDFDKTSISIPLVDAKTSSNKTIVTYGPMDLRYSTHGENLRNHHLSFGQKRLFSLLHYFDAHQSIVLADELVNGLHHEWIGRCIELTEARQSFLSSQNPLLFDFMSFESAEDAAGRFIECGVDAQGHFVWKNMSLVNATEFYEVYQVGTQHVSEILQTRGYW